MGIKTVAQPPYSPDLTPCDFWLFPKLTGCRYETIEEMKEAVKEDFDGGLPEVVGMAQQVQCSRRRLLRRGLEFHVCTINKSTYTKKVWKLIVCTSYICISNQRAKNTFIQTISDYEKTKEKGLTYETLKE